jgi:hypothetical protein
MRPTSHAPILIFAILCIIIAGPGAAVAPVASFSADTISGTGPLEDRTIGRRSSPPSIETATAIHSDALAIAAAELDKVLAVNPGHIVARMLRMTAFLEDDRVREAEDDMEQVRRGRLYCHEPPEQGHKLLILEVGEILVYRLFNRVNQNHTVRGGPEPHKTLQVQPLRLQKKFDQFGLERLHSSAPIRIALLQQLTGQFSDCADFGPGEARELVPSKFANQPWFKMADNPAGCRLCHTVHIGLYNTGIGVGTVVKNKGYPGLRNTGYRRFLKPTSDGKLGHTHSPLSQGEYMKPPNSVYWQA